MLIPRSVSLGLLYDSFSPPSHFVADPVALDSGPNAGDDGNEFDLFGLLSFVEALCKYFGLPAGQSATRVKFWQVAFVSLIIRCSGGARIADRDVALRYAPASNPVLVSFVIFP